MKSYLGPSSSVKSSTTAVALDDCRSETRDSCYYPGCKKSADCNCEICLASINATLDLMPISIQKSSITKLSASRTNVETTPISFDRSEISTPRSSSCSAVVSPHLKSTARLNLQERREKERRKGILEKSAFWKFILGLSLVFLVEFAFPWIVACVSWPVLTREMVRSVGERSSVVQDLNGKVRFLQNELKGLVDGEILNCSNTESVWKINQDGLLLNSRCILYKSIKEEVSIWGWPLQTAGLLRTGFSSRSFTILTGRVTEWSNGMVGFSTRRANASWVQRKWKASVMQLDPNTWILEYRRNSILENSRLLSVAFELLKYRISAWVSEGFWLVSAFENQWSDFSAKEHLKIPT